MIEKAILQDWLDKFWNDYCNLNPFARAIEQALKRQGEHLIHDHITLKTFADPRVGIAPIANILRKLGYEEKHHFESKEHKLYAVQFHHADEKFPKFFISELQLEKCSGYLRDTVATLLPFVKSADFLSPRFMMVGRPWPLYHSVYQYLAKESPHAAWVAAHGFRPHHFSLAVHFLRKYRDIDLLNHFLLENSFPLNETDGTVRGTPEELLEISATTTHDVPVHFTDGEFAIPAGYFQFVKRYPLPDGKMFHGYATVSVDNDLDSSIEVKAPFTSTMAQANLWY